MIETTLKEMIGEVSVDDILLASNNQFEVRRAITNAWLLKHPERCPFCLEPKHREQTPKCNMRYEGYGPTEKEAEFYVR